MGSFGGTFGAVGLEGCRVRIQDPTLYPKTLQGQDPRPHPVPKNVAEVGQEYVKTTPDGPGGLREAL